MPCRHSPTLDCPTPIDDASRRQFLIGATALATLFTGYGDPATTVVPRRRALGSSQL